MKSDSGAVHSSTGFSLTRFCLEVFVREHHIQAHVTIIAPFHVGFCSWGGWVSQQLTRLTQNDGAPTLRCFRQVPDITPRCRLQVQHRRGPSMNVPHFQLASRNRQPASRQNYPHLDFTFADASVTCKLQRPQPIVSQSVSQSLAWRIISVLRKTYKMACEWNSIALDSDRTR